MYRYESTTNVVKLTKRSMFPVPRDVHEFELG